MNGLKIHNAVVNGPLGAVGMALCKVLTEQKITTWAVCFPGDRRIEYLPSGVKVIECDMRNIDSITKIISDKVDAFFHLSWMGTIGPERNNAEIQTENIRCAVTAAKTAYELGSRVFVGVGSQAEHGHIEGKVRPDSPCSPTNGYGIAKLCAGQMTRIICNQLGLRHVWARILSAYGPGDGPLSVIPTVIDKLLKGERPSLTKGEQKWDFCYSSDVANALLSIAISGKNGKIYPIGSGQVRPLVEYFEIIRDIVNPDMELGIGELPYADNQVMYLQADLSDLIEDTGFTPVVPFEEGIRLTLDDYKRRLKA